VRLYKVIILVNIALGIGYLFGYHWWGQEVIGLRRADSREAAGGQSPGRRAELVDQGNRARVCPRNEPDRDYPYAIPGLMGSMTMGFRADNPKRLRGLNPSDVVQFTLKEADKQLIVVTLRKERSP
jgi:hypothetical protein